MAFDFVLPDLREEITEGEIRKWLVKEGDEVAEHQTVLEVETDKAIVEVPSPRKGIVGKIHKAEGDVAKVGEPLVTIMEKGEQPAEKHRSVSVVGVLPEEAEVLDTPAVRALARELGVSLEGLRGTGPDGSISREDVMKARVTEDQYGPSERLPLRGLREREKGVLAERGIQLTLLPYFIKAIQHALATHPLLISKRYYNIAIAVDKPDGTHGVCDQTEWRRLLLFCMLLD